MSRSAEPYVVALLGIAIIAVLTAWYLPVLGLASAALLFLLPVLYGAVRGGIGPALVAALGGAAAYNYFLLPPRFTFQVHGLENLVSVFVLVAVALVTSRLATRLKASEREALAQAHCSEEAAELSALLAGAPTAAAVSGGLAWVTERYGEIRLLDDQTLSPRDGAFSSLDLAAGAWALHNGDLTGHGTEVMPAADWTFLPLAPKSRSDAQVAALARPANGSTRDPDQLRHLAQLCLLLGQSRDRERLEIERRERERLEATDRLRRTFLASLAHDFRTPLTVITGRLAQLGPAQPEAREALAAAQRLDRMMSDLVGAARLEAGSVQPHLESLDLIDAVSAACEAAATPPQIVVERHIPLGLPFVRADAVMLTHILTNLLDNALRHAVARVQISARAVASAVELSVCDDGPGIPVADRVRIFERFQRLEGSDRLDGSGLGLAIVKGFADAMGMGLSVTDAALGGSCFRVEIPLAAGALA